MQTRRRKVGDQSRFRFPQKGRVKCSPRTNSGLLSRSDDLDSVGELYIEDDFRQLVVAVETTPAFLGGLGELEDHGERSLVRETSLGADGAVAHRCERAFNDVRRAQMLPVLGGEVVEGE